MTTSKTAVTMDEDILRKLDRLVADHVFARRSRAVQEAVVDKLGRLERSRLTRECATLDPVYGQTLAEEGLGEVVEDWPDY